MPQRIEVPGIGVVEFPDGMTDDQIVAAIKANAPKPNAPQSGFDRFSMGMGDQIQGAAQLLTKALPSGVVEAGNNINNWLADKTGLVSRLPAGGIDQQTREREQAYASQRGEEKGVDWLRLLGNVASPTNIALASAGPAMAGLSLGSKVAVGAGLGAGAAALDPVTSGDNFAEEKAKQMGIGAIGGGIMPIAAAGLGRIISPKASINPDLSLLKSEGVKPTIGQSLGGRWNTLEEKATSLPILGDAISNARAKALQQFNEAAINRTTAPIGAKASGVGQDAVKQAGDLLSDAYEAGKKQLGFFTLDRQGAQELSTLKSMAQRLPTNEKRAFNDVWQYLQDEISPNGSITADSFKRIDSKIGKEAARFGGSNDAYQQKLGDALKELQRVVTENAKRANPTAAEALKKADAGWAQLVRLEGASKAGKNAGGVFTPAQLNQAIQTADRSVRKRAVSRGDALMQDLANAGQNVIGNKVPNSFTTDRALVAGGGLGAYFVDPMIPAALLGGAGLYTSPGQSILRGAVSSRPSMAQPIAGLLNNSSPMLAPASGLLALDLFQ